MMHGSTALLKHSACLWCLVQYAFVQAVDVETLDMGTYPMSVGGVKVYKTTEDEGIFECPLTWGSNARVRISARVMLGPFILYIPVEVQNLQVGPVPPLADEEMHSN